MRAQGIRGPPYKFLQGNTKEVLMMRRESTKTPMGLIHDVLPRVLPHINLWTKLYGRSFLSWHGCRAELYITEPDLIKEVLNNKNGVYVKGKPEGNLKKLLGDGLVMAEGKKWSRQRKLANHAFHVENLKNMVPTMISSVEKMIEKWGYHEQKEIEVEEEFRVLTSDVISKTAFGSNYIDGQKIFAMLRKLTSIIAANALQPKLPVIGKFIRRHDDIEGEKLEHGIRESFIQIIERRKETIQTDLKGYGSDYLGLLVAGSQEEDETKRLSIDDMIDECKTFYFAGHETTMNLLTWTIFLLAINTDWQEKARKEVFDIFGENYPHAKDNGMGKLKTMTMIINETLRLYTPVATIRRTVASQVKLGEILLPPGIEIVIPPLVSHYDPQIWGDDVHLFTPDRFSEGLTKAAENTNAYLPFGMGPRICVGSNFAVIEAKIALSMILQRYTFTLSPSYVHSPILQLLIRPQHGVQIMFHGLQGFA
ncbi:hypothetical protein ACHQM5_008876 [Ranunculus cassubicifolius]